MKIGDKFIAKKFESERTAFTSTMNEYAGLECRLVDFFENGIYYVQFKNGEHFFWESSALKPI